MAFVIADRVRETTTTIGTGSVTLGGAYTSFQTFSAAIGNGNNTYYTIASASSGEWEVGIGTYTSGGNLLSRDTVLASSNAGNLVNFSVGSKDVFVTQPSERSLLINSGSTGLFAGNAAFTANGIPYANSTTTLTTGSALTFDGTNFVNTAGYLGTTQSGATSSYFIAKNSIATSGVVFGAHSSGAGYIDVINNNPLFFAVNDTERMRLDSSGNLGIGTSSPTEKLSVNGGIVSTSAANLSSGAGAYLYYTSGTTSAELTALNPGVVWLNQKYNALTHIWNNSGSEAMRLDSSGNLGIGTSSPAYKLDVSGTGNFQGIQTSGSPSLSFGASRWMTQQETGFARTYYCGPNASTYQGWEIYRATSTGSAVLTASFDSSGNLGLGVTPSAWISSWKVLEQSGVSLASSSVIGIVGQNWYINSSGTDIYRTTAAASIYKQTAGVHSWGIAPSGNAGDPISFTQAMTLTASGNLLIGTTSDVSAQTRIHAVIPTLPVNTTYEAVRVTDNTSADFKIKLTAGASTGVSNGVCVVNTAAYNMAFEVVNAERMRLDSSGNLGLGVTPSAWSAGRTTIQINGTTQPNIQFTGNPTNGGAIWTNSFFDGTSPKYVATGAASIFATSNGGFQWQIAPSGTAGTAISFTQAMTLDASGNLGVGTTSPASFGKLSVVGTIAPASPDLTLQGLFSAANNGEIRVGGYKSGGGTYLVFSTGADAERMRLDSSGNLGLGVTPSAWGSGQRAIQTPAGAIWNFNAFNMTITQNAFSDGTERYIGNGFASKYNQNSGTHVWSVAASGNAGDPISFTQAMTLDASGNLLVGTTTSPGSPNAQIVAAGTTDPGIQLASTSNGGGLILGAGGGGIGLYTYTGAIGSESYSERARITSGGDLLVGTTAAAFGEKFNVTAGNQNGALIKNTQASENVILTWNASTTGDAAFIAFATETSYTGRGTINYNRGAGLVSYNTTSDYRAKDIIGPVANSGAIIDALKVYEGQMKGATQSRPMLVAHEAQAVVPYAVTGEKDAVNDDGTPKFQQMDVSSLVPLLLAELQSLRARVAQLESKGA